MVKAGILEVANGGKGGVRLRCRPEEISGWAVVGACQRSMGVDICVPGRVPWPCCGLHYAVVELPEAIVPVLGEWIGTTDCGGEAASGLMASHRRDRGRQIGAIHNPGIRRLFCNAFVLDSPK